MTEAHVNKKRNRKKICFFSGDITRSGGTERVACLIANGLAERQEFQIFVLSLVEKNKTMFFSLKKQISHQALGRRWLRPGPGYLALVPRLRNYLKENEIDVIVDIDIVLDVLSIPAAYGRKTKVVSWEHFSFGFETAVRFSYRNIILRYVTTKADAIVTLTDKDRQAFIDRMRALPPVFAIYNPVEPVAAEKKQEKTRKKQWIITTGRLVYEKGLDYLLRTAEIVLKKYPDWQWIVLGDGDKREWLQDQIQKRHLERQLLLKGTVREVDVYLSQAQIFVLTSRREGLPMCLLEAKAHGLALVSFDIETGPDELITNNSNGFLIPAYDCERMAEKIGQLLEHPHVRYAFMEHAQDGMEKFQPEAVLYRWNEVLLTVCG